MPSWPAVSLEPSRVALGPGDDTSIRVAITNTGDVVEHYGVQILGLPPGQVSDVDPPVTKLHPGESGQVSVRLKLSEAVPPDAATLVLGVLVRSPYRAEVSRAEELRLEVLPAPGLSAQVEPEVASGSRASYRISLRNDGNTHLDVVLSGSDPEGSVRLSFSPLRLSLPPGGSAGSELIASASRPLTGRELQRRIAVVAQAGAQKASADLTLVQKPRIAGGLMRVVAAAGGLLVAAGTMFGATLLVTHAIAGAGRNTQNIASGNGEAEPGAAAGASASAVPSVTVSMPVPSVLASPGAAIQPPPASAGPAASAATGTPVDLNLAAAPADGRAGWHVIESNAYPGVLLSSAPPKQLNPSCADETRVQFVSIGGGFVSSGSVRGAAGQETGLCMDMPILIQFDHPMKTVTVTVRPTLAGGRAGTASYAIIGAGAATPSQVSGMVGQPIQLTWADPAGVSQVQVGGYPGGYNGTITAIQRITAS